MTREKIIRLCERAIDWLLGAVIFLTPVWFAFWQENFNVFELNKLVIVRVFLSLTLFIYLIKINLLGRIEYRRDKVLWLATGLLLVAYVLLGVIFSSQPQRSLWGNYERQQGIYSLLYYWLFFVLLTVQLKNWRQIKLWLTAVVFSSALVGVYGLAQKFGYDFLSWKEPAGRIFSTLGQPNFLGHYLAITLPLTVYYLFFIARKIYWRLLIVVLLAAQFLCLLFTYSRSAWLAMVLAAIWLLAAILVVSRKKKRLAIIYGLLLIFLLGGFFYARHNPSINSYVSRLASSFDLNSVANRTRLFYWGAAWQEFKSAPWPRKLVGYGKDSQSAVFIGYYRPEWSIYEELNSFPDRAHNSILDAWLEFGLAGLAIFALFNGYLLYRGVQYLKRRYRQADEKYYLMIFVLAALAAYFVAGWFGFPLTTHYLYYYFLAGMLVWLLNEENKGIINWGRFSLFFRWTITVTVTGFVAFFLYFFTIKAIVADYYLMRAKKAEARLDCAAAMQATAQATDSQPLGLYYKEQYIFIHTNCLPAITGKQDLIIERDNILGQLETYAPQEYGYHILMNAAHAYALFGRHLDKFYYAQAEKYFLELIRLNPYISVNYQDYGRMKMWAGDYQAAIRIFNDGLGVLPAADALLSVSHRDKVIRQTAYFYELLAQSYAALKDLSRAAEYYSKIIVIMPNYLTAYQRLADVYEWQGLVDKAINQLKQARDLNPTDPAWSFNLALIYYQQGLLDEAEKYAALAVRLQPDDLTSKNLLADIKKSAAAGGLILKPKSGNLK